MTHYNIINIALVSLLITGCTADALRPPSLDDNKLFYSCSDGLFEIYTQVRQHRTLLAPPVKQKITSLLIAAEIDGQFKHFPDCVNKLERARFFIQQAKLELPDKTENKSMEVQ